MQGRTVAALVAILVVLYLVLSISWSFENASKRAAEAKARDQHAAPKEPKGHGAPEEPPYVFRWAADLGIWTVVVFLGILIVLRLMAWKPWNEMTAKREEAIRLAAEEAKIARDETRRTREEFEARMRAAREEIPKMIAEAHRDAEVLRQEMIQKAEAEVREEEQRLRREIQMARDQALHEIWEEGARLATLISARTLERTLNDEDHRRLTEAALKDVRQAGARWKKETS